MRSTSRPVPQCRRLGDERLETRRRIDMVEGAFNHRREGGAVRGDQQVAGSEARAGSGPGDCEAQGQEEGSVAHGAARFVAYSLLRSMGFTPLLSGI
jgi:hypothetical protein